MSMGSQSVKVGGQKLAASLERIYREAEEIRKTPNLYWWAAPLVLEDPYEWHFTIRGTPESEFAKGIYHGRFVLPLSYPFSPPSITLLTPNGRFETGKKVCLSTTSFHPELWQPAWSISSILDALVAFLPAPADGAIHGLDWSPEVRRRLAKHSVSWRCAVCQKSNQEIFVERYNCLLQRELVNSQTKTSVGGVSYAVVLSELKLVGSAFESVTVPSEVALGERDTFVSAAVMQSEQTKPPGFQDSASTEVSNEYGELFTGEYSSIPSTGDPGKCDMFDSRISQAIPFAMRRKIWALNAAIVASGALLVMLLLDIWVEIVI